MATFMNEQKFNQLKLITDLKTAGSMTDAKFKEMKKEIDKMPDLVSAPGEGGSTRRQTPSRTPYGEAVPRRGPAR